MYNRIGTHVLADIDLADISPLIDRPALSASLIHALELEDFNVIAVTGHDFPGGGFTTVVLLAESHATLHTYPELGYLAFDCFSCGAKDPNRVLEHFLADLDPKDVRKSSFARQTKQ